MDQGICSLSPYLDRFSVQLNRQAAEIADFLVRDGNVVVGFNRDDDGRVVGFFCELPEAVLDAVSEGRCGEAVDVFGVVDELHDVVPRMG